MCQKVLLSAALMHDPRILILDEPDSVLTSRHRSFSEPRASIPADGGWSSTVRTGPRQQVATTLILQNGTAVGHGTVAELRDMLQQPSLEMVFRQVTAEPDTSAIARNLMDAMRA
jgi:ABC-2 type transport system ATP-binding protein